MRNQNLKPVFTVQEIENTWEQEVAEHEKDLFGEFGITKEDNIYEAEVVETAPDLESNLIHQPPFFHQNKNQQPIFYLEIKLNNFYLTNAGSLTSFLWFHNQAREITLENARDACELLHKLESEELRLVNKWGLESENSQELKEDLVIGLQTYLRQHQNGETILATFNE